jgi:hypothetical protein
LTSTGANLKLAFEPIEDWLLLVPNNSSPLAWISKLDCDVNELQDDPNPINVGSGRCITIIILIILLIKAGRAEG